MNGTVVTHCGCSVWVVMMLCGKCKVVVLRCWWLRERVVVVVVV